ncbi:hypothetical protein LCGC14_1005790 [marine sediment metagenome]|uniref:Uncharacterized protein n=1 Tax=marine sediment metagenome TaxID=412755 RepID=A0A0F9N1S8_9ZZZZ
MVEKNKTLKKKKGFYSAKIGCWNCDSVYEISIKLGMVTPEYIMKKEPPCRNCGCNSLRTYSDYKTEKIIMKDVMLHHRIEHMNQEGKDIKPNNDYIK